MAESLARSDPNHFSRLPQGPVTQVTRQLSGQQPVLVGKLGGTAITDRPRCLLGDVRDFLVSSKKQ